MLSTKYLGANPQPSKSWSENNILGLGFLPKIKWRNGKMKKGTRKGVINSGKGMPLVYDHDKPDQN